MTHYFLTLETTCDETAAAIVTDDLRVLGSVVASQEELHAHYGGVVPEIASRAHLERILPVIEETFQRAYVQPEQLSAIAVANRPGLAGSLLIGLAAAKALCVAWKKPLLAINHLQAHIYAGRITAGYDIFPCVGLVVSGGHTSLYRCDSALDMNLLGSTIDDAAGEAFDKVATMLGLPYPGGPHLERAAQHGDSKAFAFPRSFWNQSERLDFSFSGLKTAVRYALAPQGSELPKPPLEPKLVADLAASFQQAVIDVLIQKSLDALKREQLTTLCVSGGVAANQTLRAQLQKACDKAKKRLIVPPPALCTDNAVMGAVAVERFKQGLFETLELEVFPGLER